LSHESSSGINVEKLTLTGTDAINGTGNDLANTITGNGAANIIASMQGKETIKGGVGNDVLIGGAVAETLSREAGADRFRFDTLETSASKDTIKDFEHGIDRLEISKAAFTVFMGDLDGLLDPAQLAFGTKATTSDHRLIYDQIKGALYYDADGAGGAAQIQIAQFSTKPLLDAGDFLLV
jgi:Ca2+-binding RTX toxin-like protein